MDLRQSGVGSAGRAGIAAKGGEGITVDIAADFSLVGLAFAEVEVPVGEKRAWSWKRGEAEGLTDEGGGGGLHLSAGDGVVARLRRKGFNPSSVPDSTPGEEKAQGTHIEEFALRHDTRLLEGLTGAVES